MFKQIKFAIALLIALFSVQSPAQNLVPNGGFEDTSACSQMPPSLYPTCGGSCYTPPWFEPLFGTIDYYNYYYAVNCGGGGGNFSNYYNILTSGFQLPNSGDGMMGLVSISYLVGYREYLQCPLTNTLVAGHVYNVSFKVSLANHSRIAVGKIGLYFSADSMLELTDFQGIVPQIISTPGISLSDTLNWMTISGYYTSTGTENFLTIGNFYSDSLSDTVSVIPEAYIPGADNLAYYYIDDVSIVDTTVGIVELQVAEFDISPNPTHGLLNVHLPDIEVVSIQIYNRVGTKIREEDLHHPPQSIEIDLSSLPDGIYLIKIRSEGGSAVKKVVKVGR